jgi:hypothetical protein
VLTWHVPIGTTEALHVMTAFALSDRELAAALEALPDDADLSERDCVPAPLPPLPRGAARTGALLLLRGVLEQRAAAMRATGSAAEDAAALDAAPPPPPRLAAALAYREAQKRCAEGYLATVRAMLDA